MSRPARARHVERVRQSDVEKPRLSETGPTPKVAESDAAGHRHRGRPSRTDRPPERTTRGTRRSPHRPERRTGGRCRARSGGNRRPKYPGRPGRPYPLRRGASRRGRVMRSLFRELNAPAACSRAPAGCIAAVAVSINVLGLNPQERQERPEGLAQNVRPVAFTAPSGVSASLVRDPVTFNGSMPSEGHRSMPPLLLPDVATSELLRRGSSRCGCKKLRPVAKQPFLAQRCGSIVGSPVAKTACAMKQ
jgi:hypothetical protein